MKVKTGIISMITRKMLTITKKRAIVSKISCVKYTQITIIKPNKTINGVLGKIHFLTIPPYKYTTSLPIIVK